MDLTDDLVFIVKLWAEDARYVKEIRLFGSRAQGCARENSDIDLAITVVGSDPGVALGNYMAMSQKWQTELTKLLWMNVHVALYNDPANDMVRLSCEESSVLLFP